MRLAWVLGLALLFPLAAAQAPSHPLKPSPHTGVCGVDLDGDGVRTRLEPAYLTIAACGGRVAAGDARLSNGTYPGGTLVRGDDRDVRLLTLATAASYGCYDLDGGGSYNAGDAIFVHFGTVPGAVQVGDLRLTGHQAFEPVLDGDTEANLPLLACPVQPGGETYDEYDGVQGFGAEDSLFLDLDSSGFPSLGDLRLAVRYSGGSQGNAVTSSISPQSSTTASPSGGSAPAATAETTTTPAATTHAPSEGMPAPRPGMIVTETPSTRAGAGSLMPLAVGLALAGRVQRRLRGLRDL